MRLPLQPRCSTASWQPCKLSPYFLRFQPAKRPSSHVKAITKPDNCDSVNLSLLSHLLDHVDGFIAQQATSVYPQLAKVHFDAYIQQNLAIIQSLMPARVQGQLFSAHPQLLTETDMQSWMEFLTSFGFERSQIVDVMRATPEVFYKCNVYQAGQLLLFLQQDLQLPIELVTKQCLRWAAALQPETTQASMVAVATCLQQQLNLNQQQLLTVLQQFPEILGWDVGADLLPKLAFFASLGPQGVKVLDTLYDSETGWMQGLRSWQHTVEPKLQLLSDLFGSEASARAFIISCPTVLKMPVESRVKPLLTALESTAGLTGQQVAQLLQQCPAIITLPTEAVVSRVNFLIDVIGSESDDLIQYPGYLLLSLADTIGPRYYYLARQGMLDSFNDAQTGAMQLQRVLQPDLTTFLKDVSQISGADVATVSKEYNQLSAEWDNLLGWCADKAFSSLDDKMGSSYEEQLNLFYVLVQ